MVGKLFLIVIGKWSEWCVSSSVDHFKDGAKRGLHSDRSTEEVLKVIWDRYVGDWLFKIHRSVCSK